MKRKVLFLVLFALVVLTFSGCVTKTVEFKISFVSDGEVIHTISTTGDEAIKLPENPTKEGYVFDGWYWDEGTWQKPFTANSLVNEPLTDDMSVYAKWTLADLTNESFEVSFNTMGGNEVNSQLVKYNNLASQPADPTKSGYIFAGWYKDADCQTQWSFYTDKITGKTTIYAKWVSENDNEGAEILTANGFEIDGLNLSISVDFIQSQMALSSVIKVSPGATYMVSTDIAGVNQIPTGTVSLNEGENVFYILVTSGNGSNKTQYIVTIEREKAPYCNITLELKGGSLENGVAASFSVNSGEAIEDLPTPTREGYRFDGWEVDGEFISLPYTPDTHTTLSAVWTSVITLYLDSNGGALAQGEADEIQAVPGENIGELPVPTRYGYKFLGWYEDGNQRYEITKTTKVMDYDMELVALWESLGKLLTVEFLVDLDASLADGESSIVILEGERLSSVLSVLPTATRDGYDFKGWKDSDGILVTTITRVNKNMELTPIWEAKVYCLDGSENHSYLGWSEISAPTCTQAGVRGRTCSACGHTETAYSQSPLGHSFKEYTFGMVNGVVSKQSKCNACDVISSVPYKNITINSFNTPIINGECWGASNAGNLIDGNFTDTSVASKGSPITVTLKAKSATYVDVFTVTGYGSALYTVSVHYADGTTERVGIGSFGSSGYTVSFNIEAEISSIVVYMESPSNGADYFQELGAYVEGETDENGHYFVESISVDESGAATVTKACTHCDLVKTAELSNIAFDSFNTPTIDGSYYSSSSGASSLINNNYTDTVIAGKGSGPLEVTLTAKSETYVDLFTVTGYGRASYTVTVTYADGTSDLIGISAFGSGDAATKTFVIKDEIKEIVVYMECPSNGTDYWSELGVYTEK